MPFHITVDFGNVFFVLNLFFFFDDEVLVLLLVGVTDVDPVAQPEESADFDLAEDV